METKDGDSWFVLLLSSCWLWRDESPRAHKDTMSAETKAMVGQFR